MKEEEKNFQVKQTSVIEEQRQFSVAHLAYKEEKGKWKLTLSQLLTYIHKILFKR